MFRPANGLTYNEVDEHRMPVQEISDSIEKFIKSTTTKLSHRRARSSIDKSQVSKPFPILAYDEKELFDAMASGSPGRRAPVPKVAEKKLPIVIPETTNSSLPHKPNVSANPSSESWYTPTPTKGPAVQRSASTTTPRSTPTINAGRTNSTKQSRNHGPTPPSRSVHDTLHPTVWLLSKPLPELPVESRSSRWTTSTSSAYSDDYPYSIIDSFPNPPDHSPNAVRADDREKPLPTPPIFMSFPNTSSSSVATILATTTLDPPIQNSLVLKTVPNLKIATLVHQDRHTSHTLSQLPDSIAIQRGRIYSKALVKDNTPAIRIARPALRRRSSSFSSYDCRNLNRVTNIEVLVSPHLRQHPEMLEHIEEARMERERKYQVEQEKERELKQFEMEFGLNPQYKGKKFYEREGNLNRFELPQKKQKAWL